MLPPRRKPQRSGIARAPQREWPKHRRFVRSHECCIAARCGHVCEGPIVFAHVRHETDGGTGLKPHDAWGISLCDGAHREQHQIGEVPFAAKYGLNTKRLAREFALASTDKAMHAAMREAGLW